MMILDPDREDRLPPAQPQRRRGRPHEDPFLCSGRDSPIRCAACKGHFTAAAHPRGKTYGDGSVRRHYLSATYGGGCGKTIADQRILDRAISAMTLKRLTDPQQLALIRKIQADHRALREPHEAEISRREDLRAYWDKRLDRGVITIAQHDEAVRELDAAIVSERRRLAQLDTIPVPDLDDKIIGQIITGWASASPIERYRDLRRVWRGFQIFVAPGSSTDSEEEVRRRISRPRPIPSSA
ncbi:hypothetical protein [Streptomyces sp. NPDC046925]|uniref:hypothetical protein n=1 Tax=Streptomyces sp. NPDC046925 TaxID=3155375 RepID=UPI0033C3C79D